MAKKTVDLETLARTQWTNRDRTGKFKWYDLADFAQALYAGRKVRVEWTDGTVITGTITGFSDRGSNGMDVLFTTGRGATLARKSTRMNRARLIG